MEALAANWSLWAMSKALLPRRETPTSAQLLAVLSLLAGAACGRRSTAAASPTQATDPRDGALLGWLSGVQSQELRRLRGQPEPGGGFCPNALLPAVGGRLQRDAREWLGESFEPFAPMVTVIHHVPALGREVRVRQWMVVVPSGELRWVQAQLEPSEGASEGLEGVTAIRRERAREGPLATPDAMLDRLREAATSGCSLPLATDAQLAALRLPPEEARSTRVTGFDAQSCARLRTASLEGAVLSAVYVSLRLRGTHVGGLRTTGNVGNAFPTGCLDDQSAMVRYVLP